MASTDIEKIVADLGKRFAAPLPDYYKRRIIFWYDEEREFEDKLDEIQLSNASIIRMTGRNTFAVKKLLSHDDPYGNYLVYCPISYESLEDNWLLDIQLYSEEFRSDLISLWMDEMQISSKSPLRKTVKTYRKFFAAKERRAKVARQQKQIEKPVQLHLAVMAAITGAKSREPADIVQTLLEAGVAEDNRLYADLETYGAKDAFWTMISQATGYNEADVDLDHLICHILMTASTRTMQSEYLLGLERYLSVPHQAWCYDFVSDWLHSDRNDHLRRLARFAESTLRLPERFMQLRLTSCWIPNASPACMSVCYTSSWKTSCKMLSTPAPSQPLLKNATPACGMGKLPHSMRGFPRLPTCSSSLRSTRLASIRSKRKTYGGSMSRIIIVWMASTVSFIWRMLKVSKRFTAS